MMTAVTLLFSLAVSLEMTVAPDQPMPFVYVDDPVIVELYSETDAEAAGKFSFHAVSSDSVVECSLDKIFIHGGTGYWHAVQEAPKERGLFLLKADLVINGEPIHLEKRYCRIDRLSSLRPIPVYAHCAGDKNTCALTAIRSIGVNTIRIAANNESLSELAANASDEEAHLLIAMPPSLTAQMPEDLSAVLQSQCEHILRFEIECDPANPECQKNTDTLRKSGCPAGISLVVPNAAAFAAIVERSPGYPFRHVSLVSAQWPDPEEIQQVHFIADQNGLEGIQIHVACPGWHPKANEQSSYFLRKFFQYRAAGASYIGLNASLIADDIGTQEIMAYLNGLSLRMNGNTYVGDIPGPANTKAMVFRTGLSWLAVLFGETKTNELLQIPVDGSLNLELTDALGNPRPLPEIKDGMIAVETSPVPLYLTGDGGVILGDAALQRAQVLVKSFLDRKEMREQLPAELISLVEAIGADPKGPGCRLRFLELPHFLPWLEEQWHTQKLPKSTVVPALSSLTDIARSLAIIEEDRAELFVEPLTDTLSKTEELQSLYLTGSTGSSRTRERGDWILSEVRKLIEEAEMLEKTGRKIEANAIALIALWRAQCLKPAAQAEVVQESEELTPLLPEAPVTQVSDQTPAPPAVVPAPPAEQPAPAPQVTEKPAESSKPEGETQAQKKDEEQPADGETIHIVKSGDNPYTIAKKYKVDLEDLLKWNKLTKRSMLHIGQKIIIKNKS